MISAELRRTVRTLYVFSCGYCGVSETEVGSYLAVDHFLLQDAGGTDDVDNLVYACHACNLYKAAIWNVLNPPVLHPLRTNLTIHMRLIPDGTLQGVTPEGTHHIETLYLNRPPMVARRKTKRLIDAVLEREARQIERETQAEETVRKAKQKTRKKKKKP